VTEEEVGEKEEEEERGRRKEEEEGGRRKEEGGKRKEGGGRRKEERGTPRKEEKKEKEEEKEEKEEDGGRRKEEGGRRRRSRNSSSRNSSCTSSRMGTFTETSPRQRVCWFRRTKRPRGLGVASQRMRCVGMCGRSREWDSSCGVSCRRRLCRGRGPSALRGPGLWGRYWNRLDDGNYWNGLVDGSSRLRLLGLFTTLSRTLHELLYNFSRQLHLQNNGRSF
jgi:hypothetical protein